MSRSALQLLALCLLTISYSVIREKNMLRTLKKVKSVGWVLIALILWSYGGGRIHAENYTAYASRAVAIANLDNRFDALLAELGEAVKLGGVRTKSAPEKGFAEINKLRELKQALAEEHEKNEKYFSQLEGLIKEKKLPGEILKRQQEFVREYQAKYEALTESLRGIESAHNDTVGLWAKLTGKPKTVDWDGVIGKAVSFLEEKTARPRASHFDPKNLPHRSLKADKPIPPKLTREEWLKAYPKETEAKSISAQSSSTKAKGSITPAATTPPTPADLAETIEVQFTPEIRQLADSLGRNPVRIFNWVRNNIEFVPTWGSIQGAQLCMENRVGNAFDTASLLIALLRYSGIPARYQMGTIEVPIAKAMNWLGGFTDPRAAARFAASGGIPSAGTVEQGGVLRSIRMEHVWVVAHLDYAPSRGAIQFAGNTWVSLDPGSKLYDRFPGADLASRLGFDIAPVIQHLDTTTEFNSANGSMISVDTAFIDQTYQGFINRLTVAFPSGDHRQAFPPAAIRRQELAIAPAALPYRVLVNGPAVATLPAGLRHSITAWLNDNSGNRLLEFQAALPEIADKPISLLYMPATQADVDLIRAAVPPDFLSDHEPGTLVQRVMQQIPAHLMRVRPVLQVNGAEAATSSPVGMGQTLTLNVRFDAPTVTTPTSTLSMISWGRHGVTLDLAGIRSEAMQNKVAKYQEMVRQLQATNNFGLVANIPHEMVVLSWFNQIDEMSQLLGRAAGVAFARYPSLGFSYASQSVTQVFGSPVRVDTEGFVIDIARQFQVTAAISGNPNLESAYTLQTGFLSSLLEGVTVAKFFNGPNSRLTGISTSSALWAAAKQGIPIHLLHPTNLVSTLALLDDGYDKEAIRDWVNAGRMVLVAQRPPSVDGSLVFGYAAIDPTTGDGAFIVNDARGGWLRAICPENATEFEQCASWLVTFMDVLLLVSAAILIAVALVEIAVILEALAAIILAMLPVTAFGIVVLATPALLSIIGCADAISRGNIVSCLKDLFRYIYFWQHGVPAPF
jgi:transglutaminase-like putative cysteine protease